MAYMSTNNIRTHREAAGLTQAELAEKLSCGQSYLSRIERGAGVSLTTAHKFAQLLNCSIEDLFPAEDAA